MFPYFDTSQTYWQWFILLSIVYLIIMFFIFVLCSFYVAKYIKKNIDYNNVFYNDYNKNAKEVLEKYGDYKIKNVYFIKQLFKKQFITLLNICTLYNLDKEIIKHNYDKHSILNHTRLVFELYMPNKLSAFVMVEKTTNIILSVNFNIKSDQPMQRFKVKGEHTLKTILKQTKDRIGSSKFFNWSVFKNNCQTFTKEILITLQLFSKINENMKMNDNFFVVCKFSDLTEYFANYLANTLNLIEGIIGVDAITS
jgi:hypothetical protein